MSVIRVQSGHEHFPEIEYVFEHILGRILGLAFTVEASAIENVVITLSNGRAIVLPNVFFDLLSRVGYSTALLPSLPIIGWKVDDPTLTNAIIGPEIPILFPLSKEKHDGNASWINLGKEGAEFHFDLAGAIFFMLTRCEETIYIEKDVHGRALSEESIAVKAEFWERPIVDEYIELLWCCMQTLDRSLVRRKLKFNVQPSHDLDRPYCFKNTKHLLKVAASRALKQDRLASALRWVVAGIPVLAGIKKDPFVEGMEWLIGVSNRFNLKSQIFVMGADKGLNDDGYSLSHLSLSKRILSYRNNGHEVGIHPGYSTYKDEARFGRELAVVEAVMDDCIALVRQHYLRMDIPKTWRIWAKNRLVVDSSIGFVDRCGFRAGTSHDYELFDIEKRQKLGVVEQPLIVMDGALKADFNEALTPAQALAKSIMLATRCKRYGGVFTILWHNSSFGDDWQGWDTAYESIIKGAVELQ